MSRDPLEFVLRDVIQRFNEGDRNIRVPRSWHKYFASKTDRLFGGN